MCYDVIMIRKLYCFIFVFSIIATPVLSTAADCFCKMNESKAQAHVENKVAEAESEQMPCHKNHKKMASSQQEDNKGSDSSECCDACQCLSHTPAIKISVKLDDHGLNRQNYYLPLDRTKRSYHFNKIYNPPKS